MIKFVKTLWFAHFKVIYIFFYNLRKFGDLPRTEEETVDLLQKQGILPTKKLCRNGHHIKLFFFSV